MLVTALIMQSDGRMSHPVNSYLDHFDKIANTGLDITCFMDSNIIPRVYQNVKYIPISINELPLSQIFLPDVSIFNPGDNPKKNTLEYLIIQNSKFWLMKKAFDLHQTERLTWIDFGAAHMMKDPENVLKKLHQVSRCPIGLTAPGCWDRKTTHLWPISWRFAGTFLTADSKSLIAAEKAHFEILKTFSYPRISWEVNIWAILDYYDIVKFNWYKADHNDSILDFEVLLAH